MAALILPEFIKPYSKIMVSSSKYDDGEFEVDSIDPGMGNIVVTRDNYVYTFLPIEEYGDSWTAYEVIS